MNIMKAFLLSAPAIAVVFMYTIYTQQEAKLMLEHESARIDREFAEFFAPTPSFWEKRKENAEQRENATLKELEERKMKLKEFETQFEKAFNETIQKGGAL